MNNKYDVVIIGGGVIGSAIAYELSSYQIDLCLLEKNNNFGLETSQGNSGVIHGGFDPEPHKLEAKLNVLGNELWQKAIFPNLDFPRKKVDSLVLAFDQHELDHLKKLYQWGMQNGVKPEHLTIIDQNQLKKLEPNISDKAIAALWCTNSWAIDPVKATLAFLGASVNNGLILRRGSEVTNITWNDTTRLFQIQINDHETIYAKKIINAAGHYADVLAKKAGYDDYELTTRRGEYIVLANSEAKKVNNICFMVPTIHGKGVIVAPTLTDQLLVGPTAEDGIPKADARLITQKMYEAILNIGNRIIPSLDLTKTQARFAGSRPIDLATNDFIIRYANANQNFIHVAGTQSPALSSAPAIALMVRDLLIKSPLPLVKKLNFQPKFKIFY